MEQLKFLPKLRLTKAQLQMIIKERDYETLEVSNGECASDGISYKIDGRVVEIIDEYMMDNIIEDLRRKQMSEIEKHIVDAFQKYFGISFADVDLREIEHIRVEGDPIESYRYRGETFLYVQVPFDIDVNTDSQDVKLTMKYNYKEV